MGKKRVNELLAFKRLPPLHAPVGTCRAFNRTKTQERRSYKKMLIYWADGRKSPS